MYPLIFWLLAGTLFMIIYIDFNYSLASRLLLIGEALDHGCSDECRCFAFDYTNSGSPKRLITTERHNPLPLMV